ncbi:hydantoinase B/oxoprolinase family protein [Aquibium oceanicum]|uniref:Methylhydantoinase n=1 Tax=Aquibium oceanicum TaxID=1670800 RepID=A0A1L3SR95_9HYPH|nr:hydantoinase B/oxoprolinase family protein [Aquibium oceanicum]APH71890.1 methylhydantoinase [Aquibium oceanicum]
MTRERGCRIGFDIGGTFTDFVLLETDTGRLHTHKALTTSSDPAAGSIAGLQALVEKAGKTFSQVADIVHGTTIVTNAIIERRGARTALLTTRGFRDVLEMATEQRYDAHDLFLHFPKPLVERSMCFEVDERVAADGSVVVPIGAQQVRDLLSTAVAAGAEAIAVSFLHAYRNDAHERLVAGIAADEFPGIPVSLSSEVCAEVREYERTTTTTANAYVMPLIDPYVRSIEGALRERGFSGSLYLMQSSGQLASPEMARRFPVRLLESGPAGGAIAAGYFGRIAGHDDVIAFDMGGTTAKVCLIEHGRADVAPMIEAAREHRFKRGSGLPIKAPVIDMIEIGAGGGSIAHFDELGLMKVGPRSAGSAPGPACYGRGGEFPTVTDANLLLGYLDGASFLGGRMPLDDKAADAAFGPISERLSDSSIAAAWGVLAVVCENMAGAARAHIVEKGRDPRGYTMVAFGGAGPAHAIRVAKSLGMAKVIVPQASGVASALGFLGGRVGHDAVRSAPGLLANLDWAAVNDLLGELEADGRLLVAEAGVRPDEIEIRRQVELRLAGQVHNLQVAVPDGGVGAHSVKHVTAAFAEEYRRLYEREPSHADIEVISWRVTALGPDPELSLASLARPDGAGSVSKGSRPVWFPEEKGFLKTPVYDRYALVAGQGIDGPAIIEEDESTTVVPPGDRVEIDAAGSLVIHLSHGLVAADRPEVSASLPDQVARLEADPIGLEIMWSRLISISEESWLTVIRTAFSLIIGEMQDFACEILDAEGQSLAHSPRAMPVFNITLMSAVQALLQEFPAETLEPGDVLVTNDPWICAGHLFDVGVVTPVFRNGKVVAMIGSIGHVSDIGGTKDRMRAREIYEEGIQIPPMKLYRGGKANEDLFRLIRANVRNAPQVIGDIEALVAANAVGARRLEVFLEEYGLEDLTALATVIQSRAERAMRDAIRVIPDGVYRSEIEPLSNGVRHTFPVTITVRGDEIEVDYEGSPPELLQGGLNCTLNFTQAKTFFALKCLLTPSIRASAGCYRALTVKAPEGSIVNCSAGTSVGLRHLTGSYLVGNIFQALSTAMPEAVQAYSGLPAIVHFFGKDEAGRSFSEHLYLGGGQGASAAQDGKSAVLWPTSASNGSVEVLETRAPVLVLEKAYVPESAGAGRNRAGLGQQLRARRIRSRGPRVMVNCYPEGVGFNASGMAGGSSGGGAHFRMHGEDGRLLQDYGSGSVDTLTATDQIVEVRVGGGAGYGRPFDRPVEDVVSDLGSGYISRKQASEIYGVALDGAGALDAEGTARLRGGDVAKRVHAVQLK